MRGRLIPFITGLLLPIAAFGQSAATQHVFPQFADGAVGDGTYYQSALLATSLGSETTTCRYRIYGPITSRVPTAEVFTIQGVGTFTVIASYGNVFSLATGYATLDCDRPVTAFLAYLYGSGPTIRAGATVFPSPPTTRAQLVLNQQADLRLAIAIANDTDGAAQYRVTLNNPGGQAVGTATVSVPARSNVARFADELLTVPPGFLGSVAISSVTGTPFSAIGFNFFGSAFLTQPVTVLP